MLGGKLTFVIWPSSDVRSLRSGCDDALSNWIHWTPPTYVSLNHRPIGNVWVLLTSKSIFCYRSCTVLHGAMKIRE